MSEAVEASATVADACAVVALRALDSPPRPTLAGCPLPLSRATSPSLAVHDETQVYSNITIRAMSG